MDPASPTPAIRSLPPKPNQQELTTPPSQADLTGIATVERHAMYTYMTPRQDLDAVLYYAAPNQARTAQLSLREAQANLTPVLPLASLPPNRSLPQPTPEELNSAKNPPATNQNRPLPATPLDISQPVDNVPAEGSRSRSHARGANADLPAFKSQQPTDNNPVTQHPLRPLKETPFQPIKKCIAPQKSELLFRNEVNSNVPFLGNAANSTFQVAPYLDKTRELNLLYPKTPAATLLTSPDAKNLIENEVNSFCVISNLKPKHANFVACNRDFYHVPPDAPADANVNQAMLGTEGSAIRNRVMLDISGKAIKLGEKAIYPYLQPDNQVSILQKTTMVIKPENGTEKFVHPHILSVSAPALDDRTIITTTNSDHELVLAAPGNISKVRPETRTYLDTSVSPPIFDETNYKTALDTLGDHIITAARKSDSKRVILSGFGVNNFLGALETIDALTKDTPDATNYKNQARLIAAESLAKTIIDLRKEGREVYFSDVYLNNKISKGFATQTYWDMVNTALAKLGNEIPEIKLFTQPLSAVNFQQSALGDDWVQDTDMIVNAWDPDSLVGNGILRDNSFDGYLARYTTVHAAHAAACLLYQLMMLQFA
jgi:hypothetical protein